MVNEEDVPVKRPRLMVDVTWKALGHVEDPNSADMLSSSSGGGCGGLGSDLPVVSPPLVSGCVEEDCLVCKRMGESVIRVLEG